MNRVPLLCLLCLPCLGRQALADVQCGTPDDSTALLSAFSAVCPAAGTAPGGELVLPVGTCILDPSRAPLPLCSNLTVRGHGPSSVLKIKSTSPGVLYQSMFAANSPQALTNVVLRDFRIDQNPAGNSVQPGNETLHVVDLPVTGGTAAGVSGLTISGMIFDAIHGEHAIHAESTGAGVSLRATIVNSFFNFRRSPASTSPYYNAAIYLDGSQQVVTGNTFLGTLDAAVGPAGTAVESHGGRSSISNNTSNYYATLAVVSPTNPLLTPVLSPNNIVVANNSVTCSQVGISLWPMPATSSPPDGTLQNVSITGNTVYVCNQSRHGNTQHFGSGLVFAGIRIAYDSGLARSVDGLTISDNVVAMDSDTYQLGDSDAIASGGIVLPATGTLNNVVVSGNVVKSSPVSGIRIGASGSSRAVRVVDNVIIDAGNNTSITNSIYRHALGLFGTATEIDIARNTVYDSTTGGQSPQTNGLYSLFVSQVSPTSTTSIRTAQNTVRVNSTSSNLFLKASFQYQGAPSQGITDATGANNVLISTIPGVAGASLPVDFTSYTRYITTIQGLSGTPLPLTVPPPSIDSASGSTQWLVGQQVTPRFRCENNGAGGCLITFGTTSDQAYSGICEQGCNQTPIPVNMFIDTSNPPGPPVPRGRAITFGVESFGASGHRFFELYRTPAPIPD